MTPPARPSGSRPTSRGTSTRWARAPTSDGPDNITVNPWGGLIVAEDGEGPQHLVAVASDGTPSLFARNALSGSEFTGVHFSPDRLTLFANVQDEGYTFAISGPFPRFRG